MTPEEIKNLKVNDWIKFTNNNNIIFCYKIMDINPYQCVIKLIYTNDESSKNFINKSYRLERFDHEHLTTLTDEEKVELL